MYIDSFSRSRVNWTSTIYSVLNVSNANVLIEVVLTEKDKRLLTDCRAAISSFMLFTQRTTLINNFGSPLSSMFLCPLLTVLQNKEYLYSSSIY